MAHVPVALEPGLADRESATSSEPAVGHVRWVEHDTGGREVGTALLTAGGSLAGLGLIVLIAEGINLAVVVTAVWRSSVFLLPDEVVWSAVGAVGGGFLLTLVGVLLRETSPPAPLRHRPVVLADGVLRF